MISFLSSCFESIPQSNYTHSTNDILASLEHLFKWNLLRLGIGTDCCENCKVSAIGPHCGFLNLHAGEDNELQLEGLQLLQIFIKTNGIEHPRTFARLFHSLLLLSSPPLLLFSSSSPLLLPLLAQKMAHFSASHTWCYRLL